MDIVTLLPVLMFLALALLLFSGFPVAFILGGVGLMFGFIGIFYEVFSSSAIGDHSYKARALSLKGKEE